MSLRHKAKVTIAHPPSVTVDHLKLIGKAHRLDVLRALAHAPDGLTFSAIHYGVVKSSATSVILKELEVAGLVETKSSRHAITAEGRKALTLGESLVALGARSSGNEGAGVEA